MWAGKRRSRPAPYLSPQPHLSPPSQFPGVNSARKADGNLLGGRVWRSGGCLRLFWKVLGIRTRGTGPMETQKTRTRQRSRGCVQREVHVYCFLPRGKLPSVIDLFRAHHWKKNPGDNDYLLLALSLRRPNSSPSRSRASGRGGEYGAGGRTGQAAALGRSGEAPGHLTRPMPLRAGERGHRGFLSLPSLTLFQMILVWCSGLSIYISNLMAHKLLAKWFHYSPSVSYKREKRRERQEGRVGAGQSLDTS